MPLWETLVTEMRKARDRNLPFEFGEPPTLLHLVSHLFFGNPMNLNIALIDVVAGHYIMICKLYKSKTEAPNAQAQQVGFI